MSDTQSRFLAALHDETDLDYLGWEIRTERLFDDPNNHNGVDYRNARHSVISRLNHDYHPGGTIPLPDKYEDGSTRVANFVQASPGCTVWIIGNEMNHSQEWPREQPITPDLYARYYTLCLQKIHALPGHENDQVLIGAPAPYNNQTQYPGNEIGDWARYLRDIIDECPQVGGFALHAYSSSQLPNIIVSDAKMDEPYDHLSKEFRTYRDFMAVIPESLWDRPIYITEANPGARGKPWNDVNTGWICAAYDEIAGWNASHAKRTIRCLCIYCWDTRGDGMYINDKPRVIEDFMWSAERRLEWIPKIEPPIKPPAPTLEAITMSIGLIWDDGTTQMFSGTLREDT